MDYVWGLIILGVIILIALGFRSFVDAFEAKFDRGFIHWGNIAFVVLIVILTIAGSGLVYVAWVAFIGLGIWQMIRYGFLWGLGLWFYNIFTVIFVIAVLKAAADFFAALTNKDK
jgi:hypothetical protein